MPTTVHNLGAVLLTFLEYHHRLVLRDVDGVHVSAGLDTETRTRAAGGQVTNCGHINIFSSVELKSRFSRMDLEVDFALWVVEGRKLLQRQRSGVDGYATGVGVDNKAVINVGLLFAKSEGLLRADTGILFDGSCGYAFTVDNLVLVCEEGDLCAGDGRSFC